jgi:restriction system protein
VAKKRGFLAELQRQAQLEAKRRQQSAKQLAQAHNAALRHAEQAMRQAERAQVQVSRAAAADARAAEREAQRLHVEAREAEVAARNAQLADEYEQIDGILSATLEFDDYVDLQRLKRQAEHPPFDTGALAFPSPQPPPLESPPEPVFVAPDGEPKGLSGVFGGKKKYSELLAQAQAEFGRVHQVWQAEVAALPAREAARRDDCQRVEQQRQDRVRELRAVYDAECRQREADVAESNAAIDQLVANLGYEVEDAVQEYVSIVLGNSVYPDCFAVEHDFEFDSDHRELTLKVTVPSPTDVPSVREYKYVKAKDEIVETALPQKEQKDRYANAVAQVALRSLHEIFEADRAARIQTIALTVVTSAIDAATGRLTETPLIAVASDRPTFEVLNLSNVVPAATLAHLKANVSKNPFGLVAIDLSKGVRG